MNDHAIPFALGAVVALGAAISTEFVRHRCVEHAKSIKSLDPGAVRAYSVWAADAAQMFVVAVVPLASALSFLPRSEQEVGLGYLAVMVIGLGSFGWVLYDSPDRYINKRFLGLTRVPRIGIGANIALAVLTQLFF